MRFSPPHKKIIAARHLLILTIIAFGFGSTFILLTPPWWHHDEPGHFQVAWFFANFNRFQGVDEIDPAMRLDLAQSLNEHGFYDYRNYHYNKNESEPWVMMPQVSDPKLSYLIYSIPLRFAKSMDLADQLTLLRFVSLFYFVGLTMLIALFASELFPRQPLVSFLSGFFFAMLPGAVNQMTAVSNEPLGALLFTAFLFFARRTIVGFPIRKSLLPQLMLGFFAIETITTVWIIVPIVLFLSILSRYGSSKTLKLAAVLLGLIILIAPLIIFENNEARYWYSADVYPSPARTKAPLAPNGELALALPTGHKVEQRLPKDAGQTLSGQNSVFGFYAWASVNSNVSLKNLVNIKYTTIPDEKIQLTNTPTWFTIPLVMDEKIGIIKVIFSSPQTNAAQKDRTIFVSSVTLAKGAFPASPPTFSDGSFSRGEWDGIPFDNLIRNAGLIQVWPRFSSNFDRWVLGRVPIQIDQSTLPTILDPRSSGWYFTRSFESLEKTYWGKLGASNFDLLGGDWIYPLYSLLFLGTGIFGITELVRLRRKIEWRLFILFLSVLLVIWGQTILRGVSTLEYSKIVIPWSRYASTTFPLIAMLMAASAVSAMHRLKGIKAAQSIGAALLFALPIGLAAISVLNLIVIFEYPNRFEKYIEPAEISALVTMIVILMIPKVNSTIRRSFQS